MGIKAELLAEQDRLINEIVQLSKDWSAEVDAKYPDLLKDDQADCDRVHSRVREESVPYYLNVL